MGKQYFNNNNQSSCSNHDKSSDERNFDGKDFEDNDFDEFDFTSFKGHCNECENNKRDIDHEIKEVFKEIAKELCAIDKNINCLNKLFCKLEKLLAERGCLTSKEKALICNIRKDIQALNCVLRETAKDIKCIQEMVL